jgi:hypothetical protein
MDYEIKVVEDNQLPDGTDWVIASAGDSTYLLVTRSRFAEPGGMGTPWLAWVRHHSGGGGKPLRLVG